ncbi:hypothetical protein SAMN05660297_02902 [Natronincola peptidivorans]|uniref:Immunity protein 17 n=1 Tax=Natronincola peptidivorans TaxID=426128 RepID=A0A1I0FR30_9FIRM|nr:hypothetical protein [Natronincola peptidivorans]SET60070.1 hypothetical protein SAMN05660297_02902 [Natronincola peptidivorans]
MDHVGAGIMLVFIGLFLGFITYKKHSFFWNFYNTKILRKYLGDNATAGALYMISIVLIVTGFLVSTGILQ